MEKEEKLLTSKDLYFTEEEIKEAEEILIPSGYIQVKLSSVGKLGVPKIVHVRDYSFEEALKLAEVDEFNETDVIIQVLNDIILEDFDAGELHKQDVLEILMTILGTWYSPKLEDMPYYLNDDLPPSVLNERENIGRTTLYFNQINTKALSKEVALPITIKYKEQEVKFSLPKVKNEVIASKLVNSKYAQEENELAEIKRKIDLNTNTFEEMRIYESYLGRRTTDFLKINQALLIEGYNGEVLKELSDKLEVLPKLNLHLLKKYTDVIQEHFQFGILPEVTFESEELKETITRRFDFRALHFLSTMESADDSGFDVSFG